MASPNTSFTDIVATTLQGYSGTLADNVTNHNALLRRMSQRGNVTPATGRTIVQELEYAVNSTVKWYSGLETLDTSQSEVFSAAEYNYKQLAGNVVISGLEEIQNSGKEAIHNLLRSRVRNLEKSLRNSVATALYADGTGTSGKEIGGLQLLVADTPTNTVGGIDASANSFWQNQTYDFSTDAGAAASATNILAGMQVLWLECTRQADRPDFGSMDANYFQFFWAALQTAQRFTQSGEATAGFTSLKFLDADIFYDDQTPASHLYFLNTDYIFLRPARGRMFRPLPDKASVNQDAMVMPMVFAGNMTCSNRSLQGVAKE